MRQQSIFELPALDEYYGDLSYLHKYDNINKYDKINDFDVLNIKQFDDIKDANQWFDDMIYKPLYI